MDGGTEAGFSRAADVFTRQAHVINRRVAAAVLWPLTGTSSDADSGSGDDNDDGHLHQVIANNDSPSHDDTPEDSHADVTPTDDGPHGDVTSSGGWMPAEAARLLCLRLGVDCVSEVAAAAGAAVGSGRRLTVRKVVPRQTGAQAEWDLVITGESAAPLMTSRLWAARRAVYGCM